MIPYLIEQSLQMWAFLELLAVIFLVIVSCCSQFQAFALSLVLLVITIQKEPVSAVSSDINFPMKGRRGMKDWARTAEDKLYIPKDVFSIPTEGKHTSTQMLHTYQN